VGVVFLLAAPLAGAAGNLAAEALDPGPRVVFAGAGQSDLALLRAGGKRILIDAGPPASGVATRAERFLAAEGVGKADLLVLTHPHPDHTGGASALLASGRVGELVLPAGGGPAPWRELLAQVRPGTTVRFAESGEVLPLGRGGGIEILSGGEGKGWDNQGSLVFLFRGAPGGTALFTGDAPWPSVFAAWRRSGPLTLLKVPHHGSAARGFPGRIPLSLRASLAVYCALDDPSLPLPAPVVREAFFRALIPTARTGSRGGRVALTGDAAGVFR
jgi:beta-lactamase superfamily II metal-dependent hydrolase